ncbi:MAG: hypothetical protein V2I36_10485, partial [Desulfopila sp.]|nr:hypothetical protein [Desulfopila sp.]
YVGVPDGRTKIQPGDILISYGRAQGVAEIDERKVGSKGNREHKKKVEEQVRKKKKEKEKDEH